LTFIREIGGGYGFPHALPAGGTSGSGVALGTGTGVGTGVGGAVGPAAPPPQATTATVERTTAPRNRAPRERRGMDLMSWKLREKSVYHQAGMQVVTILRMT
jgi:hypothetical protein